MTQISMILFLLTASGLAVTTLFFVTKSESQKEKVPVKVERRR